MSSAVSLNEDPILVCSNNKQLGNFEIKKKALKVNFASTAGDNKRFEKKSAASNNLKASNESNKLFLDLNKYSDFQLNMDQMKAFQNQTYFLDGKSASLEINEYTDNDFIEEYDDEEKTEEEEASIYCMSDDDEDKNEYNHLARVLPVNLTTPDSKNIPVMQIATQNESLDTINESIRESNYTAVNKVIETPKSEIQKQNKDQNNVKNKAFVNNNKVINRFELNKKQMNNCKQPSIRSQSIDNSKANKIDNKCTITKPLNKPATNPSICESSKRPLTRQNTISRYLCTTKASSAKKENKNNGMPKPNANMIETSRIQTATESGGNMEEVEKSTITVFTEASNATKTDASQKTNTLKIDNNCKSSVLSTKSTLKQKSLSSQALEVNSNKINLKTKPPSAKTKKPTNDTLTASQLDPSKSECSSKVPEIYNFVADPQVKIVKKSENIIEPQPLAIYDMFANFEHPFATNTAIIRQATKSASSSNNRCNSAPRKCVKSTTKPKKSVTRKKIKSATKKAKLKQQKKIVVSKSEINIGFTTQYSLTDAANEETQGDLVFINPPEKNNQEDTEYNTDVDDARSININNEIDDDEDDSSSISSESSENISNIPIVSIGDINAVASSRNEIEIDNGIENNEPTSEVSKSCTDNDLDPLNMVLIDENRLKTVSDKVDVLRARLDNVLNASYEKPPNSVIEPLNYVNESKNKDQNYYESLSLNIDKINKINTTVEVSKESTNNLRSKKNINFRDAYTMVNSLKTKNNETTLYEKNSHSLNSTLQKRGDELPPKPVKNNENKTDKPYIYDLPPILSNKLCSLIEMTTAQNELVKNNLKKSPLGNYEKPINNLNNAHSSISNAQQPTQGRVSRVNYVTKRFNMKNLILKI